MRKLPKMDTAKRQIFVILMPVMILASILTVIFVPETLQQYFLASILVISAATAALIRSKFEGNIVKNKLDEILGLLKKNPQDTTQSKSIKKETNFQKPSIFRFLVKPFSFGILITVIIIETLLLFNLDISNIFENIFHKDLILVLIPSVSGIITAKWVSNSWQKRKEKNEMKMKILSQFTGSLTKKYSLLGEFIGLIYNSYVDPTKVRENRDGLLEFGFKFPETEDEKPFKKYAKQWKDFELSYWKLTYPLNEFLSNFRLYYESNELENTLNQTTDMMDDVYNHTYVFLYSNDIQEFHNKKDEIDRKLDLILPLLNQIELNIIKKDITIR